MLADEALLVQERVNGLLITEAQLIQGAIASVLSKDGRKMFDKSVKRLNISARLIADDLEKD